MAYIGKKPLAGNFVKLDAITTSATATYPLTRNSAAFKPANAESLLVSLNGVTQAPLDAYTVNDTNIVFESPLTSSDTIDYILALGEIGAVTTPADSTVDTPKLTTGAVTAAKLATDSVTTIKIADDAVTGAKIENNPTIAGNLTVSGNMVGTITTVAQPNITSVGTLGGLTTSGAIDVQGNEIILDADNDTSITADTDDQIDFKIAGSDLAHITSTYAKLRGATPLVFGENNSTGTFQSISGEVGANNLLLRSYQSLEFKNGTSGSSLTDGTSRFKIDSSGRVGIGLNPADYTEHSDDLVIGSSSGNKGITIVGGATGYSILSLNRSTNTSTTPNGALEYYHGDNQMFIKAGGNHCLQLNSDGSVNKPNQPTAFAIRTSSRMSAPAGGAETAVTFANAQVDVGNDFASNTFNCPVDGKYFVSFFGMVINTGASWANVAIKHNGVTKFNAYEDINSGDSGSCHIATSGIISASATDTITAAFSGGDTNSKLHENNYGGISIMLVA